MVSSRTPAYSGSELQNKQSRSKGQNGHEWTLTLFGSAVGAGILFLPIQAGHSGFWIATVQALLVLPVVYYAHRLYIGLIFHADKASDYTSAVGELSDPRLGLAVSLCFSMLMLLLMVMYSTAMNNSLGEFLYSQGFTGRDFAENPFFSLCLLVVILGIMRFGKGGLIRIMGGLSALLIVLLLLVIFFMADQWRFDDVQHFPGLASGIHDFLHLYPILVSSLMFFPALSSMALAYRRQSGSIEQAEHSAGRIVRRATLFLIAFTMCFVFSCLFAMTNEEQALAEAKNLSVLDVLGDGGGSSLLGEIGPIVSLFALATSFCGVFLGFRDSVLGLMAKSRLPASQCETIFFTATLAVLWAFDLCNISVLEIMGMVVAPLASLFLFLLPVYIYVRRPDKLRESKWALGIVLGGGVLLLGSYFLG